MREKSFAVRQAFGVAIGIGVGCDEPGNEPDEIDAIKRAVMADHAVAEIEAAVTLIMER